MILPDGNVLNDWLPLFQQEVHQFTAWGLHWLRQKSSEIIIESGATTPQCDMSFAGGGVTGLQTPEKIMEQNTTLRSRTDQNRTRNLYCHLGPCTLPYVDHGSWTSYRRAEECAIMSMKPRRTRSWAGYLYTSWNALKGACFVGLCLLKYLGEIKWRSEDMRMRSDENQNENDKRECMKCYHWCCALSWPSIALSSALILAFVL
jgi:hypothetical protein